MSHFEQGQNDLF